MAAKFDSKAFEKQFKEEINTQLNALTQIKVNAIFDTLAKLADPLTHGGRVTRKGKRAASSNNKRGGGIGSPVWTGQYALNHRIAINGVAPAPIIFARSLEAQLVEEPVNISPDELVAREKARINFKKLKFTDDISIVNEDPIAEQIEVFGTPLIPEGDFYGKAYEYLNARLERDMGAFKGSFTATISDASTFVDGDNLD